MKDFYELWTLRHQFEFSGPVLCSAIRATFERRKTVLPNEGPLAITSEFTEDAQKRTQWRAFIRKEKLEVGASLGDVAKILEDFLMRPTRSIINSTVFDLQWPPGDPWLSE